ncbi:MAG TPA: tetratricopeptide repeat protein [Candidatus Acidoferrales bacterium]|nr:tetratricopeptide repeat protein [Candidatus Acidoferrales bacterium]
MMTKLAAVLMLAAAGLAAQTLEITDPLAGQDVSQAPVVGKPFSGLEERHTSQILADGTHMERHSATKFYRDGQGRTRSQNESTVVIADPVEGHTYHLSTADKTVTRTFAFKPRLSTESTTNREDLPPQQMNGVRVTGERTTITVPPGALGNDREFKIVNERWYSDDLQVLVKSTNSDPRFGVTTYELTGIVQAEPDPSQFQVPRGYQRGVFAQANRSSLQHYRLAEKYFLEKSYQAAANEFREALAGDLDPKWVEVWSHINLGKIFDITGQRERAINEYRLAIRTRDDTNGAQAEAARYLKTPYQK